MEKPKVKEKTSPKAGFVKGNFRSEILRKKSKEQESAFLSRMAKYGWEGLDKTQAHWKPESNEYHYGAKDGCDKCAPKTPPLQMNGTDLKTPRSKLSREVLDKIDKIEEESEHQIDFDEAKEMVLEKVPNDTKSVVPTDLSQKTNESASMKDAPSSKPIEKKAKKTTHTDDRDHSESAENSGEYDAGEGAKVLIGDKAATIINGKPVLDHTVEKETVPKKGVISKTKVGVENVSKTK